MELFHIKLITFIAPEKCKKECNMANMLQIGTDIQGLSYTEN